jgi:hypothetical protein
MPHRPELSDEIVQRLVDVTDDEFTVPAHRVSTEDRLRIVLDQLDELREPEPEPGDRITIKDDTKNW